MSIPYLRLSLTSLVLSNLAFAQLGKPNSVRVEVTTPIESQLNDKFPNSHGVIRVPTGDYYVGTGRARPGFPHKLVRLTDQGVFVASYDQPAEIIPSPFGLYDLAYDEGRGLIYGGTDYAVSRKLYAFDLGTKSFDLTKSITIPATVQGQAARALTFNPDGDNGNGSFWIGDGKNSVSEVSRSGALLRTVANVHPNTQAAAYDDEEGIVWWFGVEGSSRKDQGVVGYAMDEATGMVTTLRVLGDNSIPGGSPAGGQVRGAQIWEAAADHENPWLLVLTDADKDWFYEMHARFVVEEGCSGTISFEGDACYSGNTRWTVTLDDSPASFAALVMATAETLDGLALPAPWKKDCKLFPRPDANFVIFPPAAVSNRAAKQPLPIPTDPALIGMSIFMQWFEIETSGVLGMSEEGEAYIHN